ncbi:MAG: aminotransferase class V-fold PLP-dependent enzyme [Planctomycetota bacterium]|nr:aminotransferase class V-fold PLP-dependent enzyme [Blastopirellula sp.]
MAELAALSKRRPEVDADWADLAAHWDIRPDTIYLNHGSFGPSPRVVRETRRRFIDALDCQPMDFYVRQFEPQLLEARRQLAEFLGTTQKNVVFAENATFAMNVVADSFPLKAGDEVLLNDHEYGAVLRIWERRCRRVGAQVKVAPLPERFESAEQVVEAITAGITRRTRLAIVSQITSPTAIILPVAEIAAACREREVAICVDGPHVPAQIDLHLDTLGVDFYCASLHKWLCAPLGTGFLYAHPRWQSIVQPQLLSWGRLLPALPEQWDEQFTWSGTRDSSLYLSVPAAIDFMTNTIGLGTFRSRCGWLANEAGARLLELTGERPLAPTTGGWYGTMCHVPLPPGDWSQLQNWLWEAHRIEVPIIHFNSRWFVRVSSHLYNTTAQIDLLVRALASRLAK